jgi:hypothetical protein
MQTLDSLVGDRGSNVLRCKACTLVDSAISITCHVIKLAEIGGLSETESCVPKMPNVAWSARPFLLQPGVLSNGQQRESLPDHGLAE